MTRALLLAFVLLGSACLDTAPADPSSTPTPAPDAAGNFPTKTQWREAAKAPTPRVEHCAAAVDAKFYVIGGYIIANPVSLPGSAGGQPTGPQTGRVEVYDAATNRWSDGPAYPHNLDHCLAVAHEGTLYVIYRSTSGGSHKLSPGASQWTKIADPPNGHNAGVGELIDGRIYVTGGSSAALDVYDPKTDKWETLDPMPTRRDHTAGAAVGARLFVVGGDVGGHSRNTGANEAFDVTTGAWSNLSALPKVRGSLHGVEWFGRILVMGGQDGRTNVDAYNDVNVYDPLTDAWSELPPLPKGRHGFAAGVWQDKVYVFAGAPQQGVSGFDQVHVLEAVG